METSCNGWVTKLWGRSRFYFNYVKLDLYISLFVHLELFQSSFVSSTVSSERSAKFAFRRYRHRLCDGWRRFNLGHPAAATVAAAAIHSFDFRSFANHQFFSSLYPSMFAGSQRLNERTVERLLKGISEK